ncbi:hypothetical protein [Amycolatopsis sp. NBC_01480]|uniref:hypothetical protein n=1 Tax=Amycolatopsis sp. NBC_01480 TaxID=2903562 RepID=UPI002E2C62E5|nr:hypothetical protein [Amycolatopsis sp. NBC_01480]
MATRRELHRDNQRRDSHNNRREDDHGAPPLRPLPGGKPAVATAWRLLATSGRCLAADWR